MIQFRYTAFSKFMISTTICIIALLGLSDCKTAQKTKTESHNVTSVDTIKPKTVIKEKPYLINNTGDKIALVIKFDEEWRKSLNPLAYRALRNKETESPYSNTMWENSTEGVYLCGGCSNILFGSNAKYASGTGWPSFTSPIDEKMIKTHSYLIDGYTVHEVSCAICEGHLGHLFHDGPPPLGLRYRINSASLTFIEAKN
jgi:peptide-methionine (R)-S-oxide reductase